MIDKRPTILHIACHGKDQNAPKESKQLDKAYLVLESDEKEGQSAFYSASMLKKVKVEQGKIDLVILQACESELIGEVFRSQIARNVICVKSDWRILDSATQTFTEYLYEYLLKYKEKNVKAAFDHAVNRTLGIKAKDLSREPQATSQRLKEEADQYLLLS